MENPKNPRRVRKQAKNSPRLATERKQEKQKKAALEYLRKTFGNVSLTCEKIGISRFTFYRWRDEDSEFNAAVEEINERTIDTVESQMLKGIQDGNARLIIFFLSTKGRGRGYGQTKENDGDKSIAINITQDEAEY